MTQRRWILWDTETSGLTSAAKAVEIAWLELDDDLNVLDQQYSLIDPECPIEPGASGVHHITNKDVADSPTIEQFFEILYGGKIVGDIILIAHNSPFDRRFADPWCDRITGEIDTLRYARRFFPDEQNHKLQTLRYSLGLDEAGEAHSALGDVRATRNLLRVLMDESGLTLADMVKDNDAPIFVHTMPFGKHRGSSIHGVPKDYLQWLKRQDNVDKDLRYTIDKVLEQE